MSEQEKQPEKVTIDETNSKGLNIEKTIYFRCLHCSEPMEMMNYPLDEFKVDGKVITIGFCSQACVIDYYNKQEDKDIRGMLEQEFEFLK